MRTYTNWLYPTTVNFFQGAANSGKLRDARRVQNRAEINPKNRVGSPIYYRIFTRTENNYTCMVFYNLH